MTPKLPPEVAEFFARMGRKGGKATSEAKREASRKNAAKARETRLAAKNTPKEG